MSAPSKILERLWQGGSEVLDDTKWFDSVGITHVVSACNAEPAKEGLVRVHVGLKDHDEANITRHLPPVIAFIHAARVAGGTVYVHCSQGVSRSSALCVAYVMAVAGKNVEDALRFVCCRRPIAFPNLGFFHQLFTFEVRGQSADTSRCLEETPMVLSDIEDISRSLSHPDNADVDISAFMDYLRANHGQGSEADESGGDVLVAAQGIVLWEDAVIAREALDMRLKDGCGIRRVLQGTRIRVSKRAGLNDMWEGEIDGCNGFFARRLARELDCAESEDEEYYQGALGCYLDDKNDA